ncbi:MAG: hypothetical protein ABIO99_04235, partial [Candidatus Limnocylindria bacterium]
RIDRRDETPQILCEAVHQWDDAVRIGPAAFGAERDRLLAARNGGRRWGNREPERSQGVWGPGSMAQKREAAAVAVAPPPPVAMAIEEPIRPSAPEPAEEPPAPVDAVPIQSSPEASTATVSVAIGEDVATDRLLGAIESVKAALAGRPGPLPVVLTISVAGATRQVRLPDRVAWDDRLGEVLRRAADVPVSVELSSGAPAESRLA